MLNVIRASATLYIHCDIYDKEHQMQINTRTFSQKNSRQKNDKNFGVEMSSICGGAEIRQRSRSKFELLTLNFVSCTCCRIYY